MQYLIFGNACCKAENKVHGREHYRGDMKVFRKVASVMAESD
jgi:hypothetical protein